MFALKCSEVEAFMCIIHFQRKEEAEIHYTRAPFSQSLLFLPSVHIQGTLLAFIFDIIRLNIRYDTLSFYI